MRLVADQSSALSFAPLAEPRTGPAGAAALAELIADQARLGDRDYRLPPAILAGLKEAGLFRMLQPRRYGGAEASLQSFFETQIELARHDMSTGWLHGVMGVLAFHLALFAKEAQDEVWRDQRDALLASSYMPRGQATAAVGGFEVSGRWQFASGADYADWFMLGGTLDQDVAREPAVFLVPRTDVEVHDTWRSTGLKGTGSQDVSVSRAFVPGYRVHTHRDRFSGASAGLAVNQAPLYRVPLPQLLFRVISCPAIGALRGLLDAVAAHNRARVGVAGTAAAADPVIQLTLGEAAGELDTMLVMLEHHLGRLMSYAERGRDAPVRDRMIFRLQATTVCDRCCRLAVRLFQAAGTSGLGEDRPFGRTLADIQASRQHAASQFEGFGRALGAALVGLEAEDMLL